MAGASKKQKDAIKALTSSTGKPPVDGYLSTGCDLLDLCVGGGMGMGHRLGTLVNYVGAAGAGKSFNMGEMIGKNHHKMKDFRWFYDDVEHRFRFDTTKLYGVQIVEPKQPASHTVEELDARIGSWLKSAKPGQKGAYIVDSLDQLANDDVIKREAERVDQFEKGKEGKEKGTFGMSTPKFLSQEFFRTKMTAITDTPTVIFFLSQVRENIGAGMYGKKHKKSGGMALEHACDCVVWLSRVTPIRKKCEDGIERAIGAVIEAKTTKSSTPRPYRSVRYSMYFDYGVDNIGSNLDFLFDLRTQKEGKLTSAAKSIVWDSKETKTLPALKEFLTETGMLEACKDAKRAEGRVANLSMEFIGDWIASHPDHKIIQERLDARFGTTCSRDELLIRIGNSPELQKELTQRVIDKWESIEAGLKSERPSKY